MSLVPPPAQSELFPILYGVPAVVERWAALPYDILLLGETGTGKSLLAQHIHHLSGRGPLADCSLAQLSEEMALSELFGHVRGAYTHAVSDRVGQIESADGGTLFLDELGDCLPRIQGMLLKVLETRWVQRLGENRLRLVDFRLIAATNRDLDALVAEGSFRQDLLARFGYYVLGLPPLRERRHEIIPLARHFLEQESRVIGRADVPVLGHAAVRLLRRAPWLYNIRGLLNVCRYLVGNAGARVEPADLPPAFLETMGLDAASVDIPLLERARKALRESGGVKTRAARRLGISRSQFYRVLNAGESKDVS